MGFMVKSDRRKTPGSFAGGGGPVLLCNPAVAGGPTMTITSASKDAIVISLFALKRKGKGVEASSATPEKASATA